MIVTIEQIQAGIIRYIDNVIAPKMSYTGKFMIFFVAPSIPNFVITKIQQYRQNPIFIDLFDENGNVKFDDVYNRAKEALSKSGGRVRIPYLDYNADVEDLEALANYIQNS